MGRQDVERFEAAAGDLLDQLGYPRACRCPAPETVHQAASSSAACERTARPGSG